LANDTSRRSEFENAPLVEHHCPPSGRVGDVVAADIDRVSGGLSEIFDDDLWLSASVAAQPSAQSCLIQ
jgi:hypothetical protein